MNTTLKWMVKVKGMKIKSSVKREANDRETKIKQTKSKVKVKVRLNVKAI